MLGKIWKNYGQLPSSVEYTKEDVLQHPVPEHVAIIMDGNGRWAKKRALPRVAGHYEGMQVVRKITRFANELGIKVLTLYAFSTENWKRPKQEVEYLMKLPEQFLATFLPELIEENVNVRVIGNRSQLPEHTRRAVEKAIEETKHNTGLVLNFALNYGSRAEITYAMQEMAKQVQQGDLSPEQINEEVVSSYLMTKDLKDPDLLIRTSGEIRLSNFMLWQLAYTEFWFTDVLWPDFTEQHLLQAIAEFQKRGRRFGGV
ncbi:undecaprenyl diphosphate synthase [Anoxybacillus tepidamans]|uniref:Isoprenyl transferase n=1 Tax=Anoxybacteroides tepidamans TaxID=265948 RepID=A0A7W8IPG5_9BACL|nr:isoprenyl transferase [Anoxybacillus tepidamans]MBB5323641.1 undecaprenyl diphosphate synthase [Anoxybacillus tepidamans]